MLVKAKLCLKLVCYLYHVYWFQEKVILSGSWCRENSLQLWQFPSGKLLKNIPIQSTATKFEGEFLYACQFFKQNIGNYPPNTNLIAVGGNGFNEVNVIKASDGKVNLLCL